MKAFIQLVELSAPLFALVLVGYEDMKLRPGMTANARFITVERTNVLKIPNAGPFPPPVRRDYYRGDECGDGEKHERPRVD